jgi:GH24 family phage-related lysozyme (muramidase)
MILKRGQTIFVIFLLLTMNIVYAQNEGGSIFDSNGHNRGDFNNDGALDLSDAIALFSDLFTDRKLLACEEVKDVNGDGVVDLSDGIFLLGFIFQGGPAPQAMDSEEDIECDKSLFKERVGKDGIYLSSTGQEVLKKMEDLILDPYDDNPTNLPRSRCTVGYGNTDKYGKERGPCPEDAERITAEEAEELFKQDLKKREEQLMGKDGQGNIITREIVNKLSQKQCDAIIIHFFNTGRIYPCAKTALDAGRFDYGPSEHNYDPNSEGDKERACNDPQRGFAFHAFDKDFGIVKQSGVVLEGLQKRRAFERDVFEKGYDNPDVKLKFCNWKDHDRTCPYCAGLPPYDPNGPNYCKGL